MSQFFTKNRLENEVKVNIIDEIHRLVESKYIDAMHELVSPETIIDIDGDYIHPEEKATFDSYIEKERDMDKRSGVVNYEACWYPLTKEYFEDRPEEDGLSKDFIKPFSNTTQYQEFNDCAMLKEELYDDMLEFERYAKFDVNSLECVQKRESIIEDINQGTPAATFEGSLEEWTTKPEDALIECHETQEDNCPITIDHVVDFLFTNSSPACMPVTMTEEERVEFKQQLEIKNMW